MRGRQQRQKRQSHEQQSHERRSHKRMTMTATTTAAPDDNNQPQPQHWHGWHPIARVGYQKQVRCIVTNQKGTIYFATTYNLACCSQSFFPFNHILSRQYQHVFGCVFCRQGAVG